MAPMNGPVCGGFLLELQKVERETDEVTSLKSSRTTSKTTTLPSSVPQIYSWSHRPQH